MVETHLLLSFHFMVETHLRQFFVYNKYMQFSLKNQYNSIIFQKYKPPKEHSLRGLLIIKKLPKTEVLRSCKIFLKLYVPKRMINVWRTAELYELL